MLLRFTPGDDKNSVGLILAFYDVTCNQEYFAENN